MINLKKFGLHSSKCERCGLALEDGMRVECWHGQPPILTHLCGFRKVLLTPNERRLLAGEEVVEIKSGDCVTLDDGTRWILDSPASLRRVTSEP